MLCYVRPTRTAPRNLLLPACCVILSAALRIGRFGLTDNYIIIIQCPFHYHFAKFLTAKEVIASS